MTRSIMLCMIAKRAADAGVGIAKRAADAALGRLFHDLRVVPGAAGDRYVITAIALIGEAHTGQALKAWPILQACGPAWRAA